MYIVTTNDARPSTPFSATACISLPATSQRFTATSYPTIGFQSCTPVNFSGGTAPPAGALGMFMRMADDAAARFPCRTTVWSCGR